MRQKLKNVGFSGLCRSIRDSRSVGGIVSGIGMPQRVTQGDADKPRRLHFLH